MWPDSIPPKLMSYGMVFYAVVQHFVWAITLMMDKTAMNATSLKIFSPVLSPTDLSLLLFIVAIVALLGIFRKSQHLTFLLPQQFVLVVSAYAAINAMYLGQFGDGVPRSHAFIIADQLPAVLIMIGHNLAIIFAVHAEKE